MIEVSYLVIAIAGVLLVASIMLTLQTRYVVWRYITKDREATIKALQAEDEQYRKMVEGTKEWAKGVDELCDHTKRYCQNIKEYLDTNSKLVSQIIQTSFAEREEISKLRAIIDGLIAEGMKEEQEETK